MTVLNLTVEVLSTGVRGLPAVRALEREYARITRYDGERVTVTVETPALPPLITPARDLQPLLRGALRAADAAVSPWYRADPVGDPYEERVDAATRSFRDILAASAPRVARNRADYIRDHFDALNAKFGYTRGSVETAFRNLLLPPKQ
jgi:hypothetical protein